jgi:hypothetical protein
MLDHVRAALIGGGGDERELLAQINRGELFLCWTDSWLGLRARIAGSQESRLCDALRWQAEDYTRNGLHISARDCDWLAAKLTGGAVQLVTAAHVSQAREAQATAVRLLLVKMHAAGAIERKDASPAAGSMDPAAA